MLSTYILELPQLDAVLNTTYLRLQPRFHTS